MAKYRNKAVSQRRDQFLSSWREFAPDVTFAGFTLAQFEDESTKPLDIRKEMVDAKTKVKGLKLKCDKADETQTGVFVLIAHAVRGHEQFGEDCALYRSLGFIPKSERKTGTRGRNKASPDATAPAPPDANAA